MTISKHVDQYVPDPTLVSSLRDTKLLLLVGITGAGKDTVKKLLLQNEDYYDFISYTTRKPRENYGVLEQQDVDYHFIDLETAECMIHEGRFIEVKEYAGNIYGTAFEDLAKGNANKKIAINDIEVQGVSEYKKYFDNVIAVFIMPPSFQEWQRRLKNRYDDEEFKREWPKRRQAAIRELSHALEVPYYHFVINDDLDETIDAVDSIARNKDHFTRKDDEVRLVARDILETMLSKD